MKTLVIAEKASQARDIRAAVGDRHGPVLPAEGHLLRLAEPEEADPAWKRRSFALLKPDGLYPPPPGSAGLPPSSTPTPSTRPAPPLPAAGPPSSRPSARR